MKSESLNGYVVTSSGPNSESSVCGGLGLSYQNEADFNDWLKSIQCIQQWMMIVVQCWEFLWAILPLLMVILNVFKNFKKILYSKPRTWINRFLFRVFLFLFLFFLESRYSFWLQNMWPKTPKCFYTFCSNFDSYALWIPIKKMVSIGVTYGWVIIELCWSGGDVWVLVIKNVKASDEGTYTCEVNSRPVLRSFHTVHGTLSMSFDSIFVINDPFHKYLSRTIMHSASIRGNLFTWTYITF